MLISSRTPNHQPVDTPTVTLSVVSPNDIASYSVLVSNAYGAALSSNANLTLL